MGKGGCSKPVSSVDNEQMYYRVPSDKPPFTLSDIKKAIPPHCFERSLIRSLSYPIFDLIVCFLLYYVAVNYIHLLPKPLTYVAWTAYAYIQGCYMIGLWVIAHDCGHNAFSNYHWVNDTVGFILHTIILVPYFSFKISHRHHHANTCLIDRDENHVPMFEHNLRPHYHLVKNPVGRVIVIAIHLLLGMPIYMLFNISGHKYDRWTSHFNPYSPMFTKNERALVIFSDVAFLAMCYLMYRIALVKGFSFIMLTYGAPILVMCAFLVLLGLLQHNHVSMPHYDTTEWDWLKGALATIDRDYGFLNHVFHHLTDSHVLHHLIPTIPHYHGLEATEAMKPVLGDYYFYDGTPFYKALWRETKECVYVQAEQEGDKVKGVYWFKTNSSVKSD